MNPAGTDIAVAGGLFEQGLVNGVPRHQVLSFGGERLGLLVEGRGLGLGQQRADLAEHLGVVTGARARRPASAAVRGGALGSRCSDPVPLRRRWAQRGEPGQLLELPEQPQDVPPALPR